MHSTHARNTVRYYILAVIFLSFLFFSNDFGLIDVQKTAIVTAVGIDRDEEGFLVTSQISVPQSSKQGNASQSVQLVSRGKTVAEAFGEINAKTGWYPKLVFCNLVVFGEDAAKRNVFDALEVFLRDEYITDDCQLAVCEGKATELLNTAALIDPSSSAAISKVLSAHAKRVGSVLPFNLKDFSIGYFGDSQSGLLPVLKTEAQQEDVPAKEGDSKGGEQSSQGGQSREEQSQEQGGGAQGGQGKSADNKPVFSAKQTALFVGGVWRETLAEEETFAVNAAIGKLRLAGYSVEVDGEVCTLSVKNNDAKLKLDLGQDGRGLLKIDIQMVAGVVDYSKAQGLDKIRDMGSVPDGSFAAAEKKLTASLITAYEKARGVGCDVFGLQERLVKYKRRKYARHKDTLLDDTALSVRVKFVGVR